MALPFNCHGTACHGLSLRRAQAMAVDAVLTEAHHSDSQHPEPINRSGLDPRACAAASQVRTCYRSRVSISERLIMAHHRVIERGLRARYVRTTAGITAGTRLTGP